MFGRTAEHPFDPATVTKRARRTWVSAGLVPWTLHQCRHIAASAWIDAGVPLHAVSRFIGHSGIAITADVYGHLVVGAEDRAAKQMDDYLYAASE